MVERRLSDGKRIAQLLASEIDGLGGPLESASVVDADPDVEPTVDGAFAYAVAVDDAADAGDDAADAGDDAADDRIATVFVQPDRARVEFGTDQRHVAERAADADLRVRPKASQPPRTLVFLEDGAQVKRAVRVFEAVLDSQT